jgi:transposase-like protein
VPDPEVSPRAKRRTFSAKYKLRIVEEAMRCSAGELGALLRREGIYSSHLANWRKLYERGALKELCDSKRGRKKDPQRESRLELERLQRENEKLRKKLWQAEKIIEVQKKLAVALDALRLEEEENA